MQFGWELPLMILVVVLFLAAVALSVAIHHRDTLVAAGPNQAIRPSRVRQPPRPPSRRRARDIDSREDADETTKILPGYFEYADGDTKGDRIRFYVAETLVGRGPGGSSVVGQILFDSSCRTISRHQAKVLFDAPSKRFWLINMADPVKCNATTINGREMGLTEAAMLSEGDLVRFGEIELKFRAT